MDAEPAPVNALRRVENVQELLEKVHINELYIKCVSSTEKLMFVLHCYR